MVATHNYTWEQGEDLQLLLVYKTGLPGQETPVVLTNYSVRMDIVTPTNQRRFTFNSAEIADVDPTTPGAEPDNQVESTLGADGTITITVPRSLTLPGGALYTDITGNPPLTTFNYDIFLRNPDNKQKKILKGQITVERSYTLWS